MIVDHGAPPAFECRAPVPVDGDTLRCAGVAQRVRIVDIDAPEMPGHCRRGRRCAPGDPIAAREALRALLRGRVTVRPAGTDRYGRIIGRVSAGGRDVGAAMVRGGWAVRWLRWRDGKTDG